MIIPIKRIIISTGLEYTILLNTRYVVEIAPSNDDGKPVTRIIYDKPSGFDEKVSIIYTNESVSSIRGKITKIAKHQWE